MACSPGYASPQRPCHSGKRWLGRHTADHPPAVWRDLHQVAQLCILCAFPKLQRAYRMRKVASLTQGISSAETYSVYASIEAPGFCRSGLQGVYLKEQPAVGLQADALSVGQRQKLVIIHDTIHVFHPHSVHISIKHQILSLVLVNNHETLAGILAQL